MFQEGSSLNLRQTTNESNYVNTMLGTQPASVNLKWKLLASFLNTTQGVFYHRAV